MYFSYDAVMEYYLHSNRHVSMIRLNVKTLYNFARDN